MRRNQIQGRNIQERLALRKAKLAKGSGANCAKSFVTGGGEGRAAPGYVAPEVTVTVAGWTET